MVQTRIEKAREAFKNNDLSKAREAHKKRAIIKGIHQEPHTKFSLSDIILGGQDGLVNVLGVILGVAVASSEIRLVLAAGFAAAFAESVSMAAVAYTSTLSDADHYQSELKREMWEIEHFPKEEAEEIRQIYIKRGFKGQLLEEAVNIITKNKKVWLDVMMEEELRLAPIEKNHAFKSAFIVGVSAIIGSIIPLIPFMFLPISASIPTAIILAALALFIAGVYKAKVTIGPPTKSGLELMIIGIVSALVGYFIGSLFKAPTTI